MLLKKAQQEHNGAFKHRTRPFLKHLRRVSYNNPLDIDMHNKNRHVGGSGIHNFRIRQIPSSVFSLHSGTDNYIVEAMIG